MQDEAIRSATPDDAAATAAIFAPIVRDTTISFEWQPPGDEQMRARIVKTLATHAWLVSVDESGVIDGYAHASPHREGPSYQWSVNTSVYARADSRGRGIGKRLYMTLFERLVALGFYRAFAGIALPNEASVALHESLGFRPLGVYERVGFKHGAWRDVGWWQHELQPPGLRPDPPKRPG